MMSETQTKQQGQTIGTGRSGSIPEPVPDPDPVIHSFHQQFRTEIEPPTADRSSSPNIVTKHRHQTDIVTL
jgi:hypothetical protein